MTAAAMVVYPMPATMSTRWINGDRVGMVELRLGICGDGSTGAGLPAAEAGDSDATTYRTVLITPRRARLRELVRCGIAVFRAGGAGIRSRNAVPGSRQRSDLSVWSAGV